MKSSPHIAELERLTEQMSNIPIFLQTLLYHAKDLILVASADGHFIWANDYAEKMLGYTVEEIYEIPFIDLVYEEDKEETAAEYKKILSIPEYSTYCFSNRYLAKSGEIIPLCWNTSGLIDGHIYCIARHCHLSRKAEHGCAN
jgi:PAS domain S-box-containing protein